jgi:hypothetical protein
VDDKEGCYSSSRWNLQLWQASVMVFIPLLYGNLFTMRISRYDLFSCEDCTLATLWKRAQSFSTSDRGAPFSKLALSKLLVLKDKKAREDYFAQQAAFVMLEGRKDVNAVSHFVDVLSLIKVYFT